MNVLVLIPPVHAKASVVSAYNITWPEKNFLPVVFPKKPKQATIAPFKNSLKKINKLNVLETAFWLEHGLLDQAYFFP